MAKEVDLVLQRIAGQKPYGMDDFAKAENKFDRDLIRYSQQIPASFDSTKNSKDGAGGAETSGKSGQMYLTVQSLLDHPYFISINTADISSVID